MEAALSPYRVLELPGEPSLLCGKMLADLGADVIKIEPPGGDAARNVGPFYHDEPHPEKSLYWFALNTNKRSITLNLQSSDGRELLGRLVRTADFVIESFAPGEMQKLGLGFTALQKINRRIILASISPFGQTGPYAGYRGSDIVSWAMGGYMYLCGEPDRAPLRISLDPQAYFHASGMAAVGCLIANHHRQRTGVGQHVDQSMQQCPAWMLTHTAQVWEFMRVNLKRQGMWRQFGPTRTRTVYPCADGYIVWMMAGGVIGAKGNRRLVEWMDREGYAPEWLKEINWSEFSAAAVTQEFIETILSAVGKFFLTKSKAELLAEAVNNGYIMAPINTARDVFADPQLKHRGFWTELQHEELGISIPYPGAPCKLSVTPWRLNRRAPLIGEHNRDLFVSELGFSAEDLCRLKGVGVI